jgi:hypothetical protein
VQARNEYRKPCDLQMPSFQAVLKGLRKSLKLSLGQRSISIVYRTPDPELAKMVRPDWSSEAQVGKERQTQPGDGNSHKSFQRFPELLAILIQPAQ